VRGKVRSVDRQTLSVRIRRTSKISLLLQVDSLTINRRGILACCRKHERRRKQNPSGNPATTCRLISRPAHSINKLA
jgi:hypothetical protein